MSDTKLRTCPFCGGEARIRVCDDEGNPRSDEYEFDAYSGVGYFIEHKFGDNPDCPISRYEGENVGEYIYETEEEAAEAWNKRAKDE